MARLTLNDDNDKETTLEKDALIYQRKHDKTEKGSFKELPFRQKIEYFRDYYLLKTVIGLVIITVLAVFAYTILRPRPERVIYTALENVYPEEDVVSTLTDDFMEQSGLDKKNYEVVFDAGYTSDTDAYSDQKLFTYVYAETIDLYIANKEDFDNFAANGNLHDLSKVLPTETMEALSDKIYYYDDEVNKVKVPVGISLTGNEKYQKMDTHSKTPYIGIVGNTKHIDYVIGMIEYLYDLDINVKLPVEKE